MCLRTDCKLMHLLDPLALHSSSRATHRGALASETTSHCHPDERKADKGMVPASWELVYRMLLVQLQEGISIVRKLPPALAMGDLSHSM